MAQGDVARRIEARLRAVFAPQSLDIEDQSERHRGHGGWREGGETHFRVAVVSDAFAGRSRIERHRAVNDALAEELEARVHALSITALTPAEAHARGLG